jgi:hypothetical protein
VLLVEPTRSSPAQSRPITYWLAWLVLVSAILLFTFNGPLTSIGIGGLIQRLYWFLLVLWLLLMPSTFLEGGGNTRLLGEPDLWSVTPLTPTVSPLISIIE